MADLGRNLIVAAAAAFVLVSLAGATAALASDGGLVRLAASSGVASTAGATDGSQSGDCGPGAPAQDGNSSSTKSSDCSSRQAGDAAALLLYAKSLPASGGYSSTGPGGATLPAVPTTTTTSSDGTGATTAVLSLASTGSQEPPTLEPLPALVAGQFRPNEVVILMQPGATVDTARALAQTFALQLEVYTPSRLLRTPIGRFRIPDGRTVQAVLTSLAGDPRVRMSQPNFIYRPTADQTKRKSALPQYSLDAIRVDAAQSAEQSQEHARALVAIIDTGIDDTHPDLLNSVRDRFDAVGDGQWDTGEHGTGIAGIIAAHGQLLGVAPNASLLSIRAFPSGEGVAQEATSMSLVRGLEWAQSEHADIINMSLAGPEDPIVDAAVASAIADGIIVVAAAGNDGPDAPAAHPAAVKGVIAVTATDQNDGLFNEANHGAYISVAAPGVDILAATPGGGYSLETGTSQAAAQASGVIALLRSVKPDLTPQAALDILAHTAKDLGPPGPDDSFGAGRIDAAAAMKSLFSAQAANQ